MKTGKHRIRNIGPKIFGPNRLGRLIFGIFIFLFGAVLTPVQIAAQTNPTEENGNYKIGIGDVLKVVVLKQDILSQDNVRVSNEGTIRMPMLDQAVPAACLTEEELSQEITNKYKKYLLNPQVYVAVKEFNANPVAVIGAVIAPGRFQLQRPMRLRELLAQVNGPTQNAGQNVQIIRSFSIKSCGQKSIRTLESSASMVEPQEDIISLSLADVMKGEESGNPFIQAGDIIRVPEAEIKQAFVIGSVKSAVTINLKEPVTLSRALAMAGGVVKGSNIEKIKISRQKPNSLAKTELIVNLKEINKSAQEDILLEANDVVDVPGPKRNLLIDIFKGLIPAVTRLPIVIP
jgi:protein involved in polysaccharide export with SLBB domain